MTHSAASYDRLHDPSDVIDGHSKVDGTVRVIARSRSKVDHAAGGIYSSIADLSKWVMVQLGDGVLGAPGAGVERRLFSSRVHQEMWSPQTIIRVGRPGSYNTHFAAYGLGFFLNDVKGYKQVSHTGGLEGMVTQITMIPELQLGIIVLTNQEEGGAFSAVTDQIKDSYFGIRGTDRVMEYATNRNMSLMNEKKLLDSLDRMLEQARSAGTGPKDMTIYTGTYRDPWLGEIVISMKDGRPWFDSKRSPKLTGEMLPYMGNSFVVRWKDRSMKADAYVIFSLNEEGKAVQITMRSVSPLTDFSYDFQDLDLRRE